MVLIEAITWPWSAGISMSKILMSKITLAPSVDQRADIVGHDGVTFILTFIYMTSFVLFMMFI